MSRENRYEITWALMTLFFVLLISLMTLQYHFTHMKLESLESQIKICKEF